MNSSDIEGYTGIYLGGATYANDIMLAIVLAFLAAFAVIFRLNTPLFGKIIANINAREKRQSIFNTIKKDTFFFNLFMTFQTLLLNSVFLYALGLNYTNAGQPDAPGSLIALGALLAALLAFYIFKQLIYSLSVHIFAEKQAGEMLFVNYNALFCTWGIFLYIPVLWILVVGKYLFVAIILFIISYLVFRAILAYRFIYIFYNKNTGLLFLSSYLCGQEIIPLVFLHEGLIYLYNIVGTTTIWQ